MKAATKDLTLRAILLGVILSVIMTAANAYLGLYAGMTVSASIPAAVISMALMKSLFSNGTILENNIVQTMASAGESLAAGIIFTVPALVIVGIWQDFQFWPTTLIGLSGGLLGVLFMIPVRRILIKEEKELTYPEGVACYEVLRSGHDGGGGFRFILRGLAAGGLTKFASTGLGLLRGTVEYAGTISGRVAYIGTDISPALMAVGYIIRWEIAALVFLGSAISWLLGIPLLDSGIPGGTTPLEHAWALWSESIRYIGVGAMVTGGLWSIISVRRGLMKGITHLTGMRHSSQDDVLTESDRDMNPMAMGIIFMLTLLLMIFLYHHLIGTWGLTFLTTGAMAVMAFFFVTVSSYIVGIVGSSNNPVSGMTISSLLAVSALFLVLGWKGDSAVLATLGVAGVVCSAASSAGDVSQDLKTGYLLGATPASQQWAQVISVSAAALVLAPSLSLLHHAYGIGTGLKAPQATLFAGITSAIFGEGDMPLDLVLVGAGIGVFFIILNEILKKSTLSFRTHVMPLAVGIYLPISLIVPMLLGGFIRLLVERKDRKNDDSDPGILLSSGMVAGEAITGIILALFLVLNINMTLPVSPGISTSLGILTLLGLLYYLYRIAVKEQ